MLKITAEEVNFLIHQFLNESGKCPPGLGRLSASYSPRNSLPKRGGAPPITSRPHSPAPRISERRALAPPNPASPRVGFSHSSFVFAQEANIPNNKFCSYKVPSGLLVFFLEKALTLLHMETHLNDVSASASPRALSPWAAVRRVITASEELLEIALEE